MDQAHTCPRIKGRPAHQSDGCRIRCDCAAASPSARLHPFQSPSPRSGCCAVSCPGQGCSGPASGIEMGPALDGVRCCCCSARPTGTRRRSPLRKHLGARPAAKAGWAVLVRVLPATGRFVAFLVQGSRRHGCQEQAHNVHLITVIAGSSPPVSTNHRIENSSSATARECARSKPSCGPQSKHSWPYRGPTAQILLLQRLALRAHQQHRRGAAAAESTRGGGTPVRA